MKKTRSAEEIGEVRDRLLAAALDILDQEGFEALTLRRIAKKTGMTAPNLYNYFPSKDAIYITLVIRGFTDLKDRLVRAVEGQADPRERARALTRAYLAFGLENSPIYDIMFTRRTPRHKDYVGTPLENLSEKELSLSMDIAALAAENVRAFFGPGVADDEALLWVIHVWSLLHGMITLHHSQVMEYVVPDPQSTYETLLDRELDLVASLARKG
ncbi:MAG: TetR/AcrR family transcriptional regulator [Proteobacteria bacterium]|nr:TetR/AcrR family transcriptional regulator [Pseudomonadota bacterium]